MKLAPGMTVQSAKAFSWAANHVAYCVRCTWESSIMSYKNAKRLACEEDSHECKE